MMEVVKNSTQITLRNSRASCSVDLFGGAIIDFRLFRGVSPLSFRFSKEQMPANNREGAPYQGHFLCLGHWGEPTPGEKKNGRPNHGQIANVMWNFNGKSSDHCLSMSAVGPLEGLEVNRRMELDAEEAVMFIEEEVININSTGRVYNMVQHPTLASPFLDQHTTVDCNGSDGFDQVNSCDPYSGRLTWPNAVDENRKSLNLRKPETAYNSVFTFIVNKAGKFGWITAYSPEHQTLIGYLWKRSDYPWIHLWQHWHDGQIQYRGIEFGTAAIHRPFNEVVARHSNIYGESTYQYLDAQETVKRKYLVFLLNVGSDFKGVRDLSFYKGKIQITRIGQQDVCLTTKFKDFYEV